MTAPTCQTCPFWCVLDDEAGECRVHAPQPRSVEAGDIHQFPITGPDDWCGEHPERRPT